jgi:hypothetical protein
MKLAHHILITCTSRPDVVKTDSEHSELSLLTYTRMDQCLQTASPLDCAHVLHATLREGVLEVISVFMAQLRLE